MSNILLTSIGTGKYDAKTKEIGYSNTRYAVNEDRANVVESAYIYDAMIELKKIDKIIFIGTTGSDWYALYEHLFYENSRITPLKPRSEDYALELYELKESKEKDLDKCREKLQTLVDTMGGVCSDIIILHYGLSIEEMNENFDRLAKAKKYIGKDDVLSFDITHSFRSLAFYELLAVNFFKLSMREGDRLDFVSYGMFEGQGEDGITPIVNQEPLLKLLDWTKAADEFKRFGTTHLLDQLRKEGEIDDSNISRAVIKDVKNALERLCSAVDTNNLSELRNMVANCKKVKEKGSTGNHVIDFIFDEIYDRFGKYLDQDENNIALYVEFAYWHIEKNRYIAAAITMIETMIKLCSNENSGNTDTVRAKLRSNTAIKRYSGEHEDFIKYYNELRVLRNKLCHAGDWNRDADLKKLKKCIEDFFELYKKKYANKKDIQNDLRVTVNSFSEK
nr:TIGR02221 family CRISPR-associated protein [uncultured Lachnoanaerobaculum sp.]